VPDPEDQEYSRANVRSEGAAMRSPTQRTLNFLREQGATVKVVEKYIKFPNMVHGVRQDLWGADILAVQGMKLIAIQTCAGASHSNRVQKSLANDEVQNWLATGVLFEIWSWSRRRSDKILKSGERSHAKVMKCRVTQLTLNGDGHTVIA
jgi:hypothetical protein